MVSFDELSDRLSSESTDLLRQMIKLHLEAGKGDRSFLAVQPGFGGGAGIILLFNSDTVRSQLEDVDRGALEDLRRFGLVSATRGGRGSLSYRLTGDGQAVYRLLMRKAGMPIDQVDSTIRRLVDGPAFAASHPSAAGHLADAFELLWKDDVSQATVSELGGHLRSALQDVVFDVTGDRKNHEKPGDALKAHLEVRSDREARALDSLVALVEAVIKLDQRVNHVRDEQGKGESPVSWKEMRRACFLTAVACSEVSELS